MLILFGCHYRTAHQAPPPTTPDRTGSGRWHHEPHDWAGKGTVRYSYKASGQWRQQKHVIVGKGTVKKRPRPPGRSPNTLGQGRH